MRAIAWSVTVTTTGTRVQLAAQSVLTRVNAIAFKARPQNTGTYCYVGNLTVSATNCWSLLKASEGITLDFKVGDKQGSEDVTNFWVDSDTSGDRVEVFAIFS